jgi:hypothetical protein
MKKYKIKVWTQIPKVFKFETFANERARKDDYFNLYIFDSFDEMYNKVDNLEKDHVKRDYIARCYCTIKKTVLIDTDTGEEELLKYDPLCGNIYFVDGNLHFSTVSHECCHAVIGYFERKIKNPHKLFGEIKDENEIVPEPEYQVDIDELFCYMQQNLIEKINNIYISKHK